MTTIHQQITELFHSFNPQPISGIEKLPQSGSDRTYFRIHCENGVRFIATCNSNTKENQTFVYFSQHFKNKGIPVPEVLAINEEENIYIQSDLGDQTLLNLLEKEGYTSNVFEAFKKSLSSLAKMQTNGDEGLDYSKCITSQSFGQQAIMSDLLYFKYYFLDTLKLPYDKEKLFQEMESFSRQLMAPAFQYFMFRDFQSRNIMIDDNGLYFIDFQGGMKGALPYDVASLLWQAKANLSDEWKDELLKHYLTEIKKYIQPGFSDDEFKTVYNGYVLIRLVQVLGAYGFRGLFERKAHFLTSIPLALKNLKHFIRLHPLVSDLPILNQLLHRITEADIIARFENQKADENTPLIIRINSFSYIQNGYPKDPTKNGGGFVFDCRGILNPGRIDIYKKQSGLDKPVKTFLEEETKMPDFLNNIYQIVDIAVEDYLSRGFESLEINFGCTGGQHRSVYAAEAVNRHLKNKFAVKTTITHLNREQWVK
ncbi:MAG: hypothetical protein RL582_998 [Bacteroidota bacterium]|jgi:aminoglycoside/choline kinase family phosphotransferase